MSDNFYNDRAPKKGEDPYLTRDEQAFQNRYFSNYETIPEAFWGAVIQKIAVDGLPIVPSQVQGLTRLIDQVEAQQISLSASEVLTAESTTATSYVDLTTPGPTLTDLTDGSYIILFGAFLQTANDGTAVAMSFDINGAGASDTDRIYATDSGHTNDIGMRATAKTLSNGTNTLTSKYKVAGGSTTATFTNRWLVAIRLGV